MSKGGFWRYENRLVAILCLLFGFVFLDRNTATVISIFIIKDLHLTNTQLGLLSSGLAFAWALSGFAVGMLSDKLERRKGILIVTVVAFSLCSMVSGLASSFAMLLAARMLMGFAEGPVLPIAQSMVVLESSERRRGLNMGIVQNLGANLLAAIIGPVLLVALAQAFGWRSTFFIAGVPGLLCALVVWKWVREPRTHAIGSGAAAQLNPPEKMRLREMFRYRNMWLCIGISCFMVPWIGIGFTFLPTLFVNFRHISETNMSWLMSVLGVSATVFGLIVPALSDKFGRKPVMLGFALLGVIYPFAALYYSGPLPILALLIFISISAIGTFPIFMAAIPSETIPPRFLATSMGLVMGIGELVGGGLGPALAGRAADRYGIQAAMFIAVGCALGAACLALFVRETAPAKTATPDAAGARTAAV